MLDVGVCLATFANETLESALAHVETLGIEVVDLPLDSMFKVRPDATLLGSGLPNLRRQLDQRGVRVACVSNSRDCQLLLGPHGPHTDSVFRGGPEAKRAHGGRHAYEAIEVAAGLGASMVRLFFGCPDYSRWMRWGDDAVSWDDNVHAFSEVAAPIAEAAQDAGVTLCIEPHVKQVPYNVRTTQACIEELGGHLAVCFDAANLAAIGYDPVDAVEALEIAPASVHVKDVELWNRSSSPPGRGWVHYGPCPPIRFRSVPRGTLNWPAIVTSLIDHGFSGPLFIEHEDVLVEPDVGVEQALTYLRALLRGSAALERWW